jgi:hypothetical protein
LNSLKNLLLVFNQISVLLKFWIHSALALDIHLVDLKFVFLCQGFFEDTSGHTLRNYCLLTEERVTLDLGNGWPHGRLSL